MTLLDWAILVLYFLLSFGIAVAFSRRAGQSTEEFFLSGRNLPWWLAGTSMVATTFAADTPLAVTELVARHGISGNWLWWNFLFGSMLTVFFFARLWRRAGVFTDLEFIELRYSGRAASFLRGFRALYLGLFINSVIMGWVNLAMASVLVGMFDVPPERVHYYVFGVMVFVAIYAALSGLWGIAVTDLIQFVLAMAGALVLCLKVLSLPQVGGISGLKRQLPASLFRFTPDMGMDPGELLSGGVLVFSAGTFVAYLVVQWWSSWYPGAEPGGGGYVAQRMLSARDERHALLATLWFTIAHYCLRPWPWILVGLATLILYPDLDPSQQRMGYVYAMRDHLPAGLRGMVVAAFFAAYMSTITTQLNWGTSYLVNDFYRRFFKRNAGEDHYVLISRLATLILMGTSVLVTLLIETISGAWLFVIEAGAGLGLVLILRFYWWRVNAWSEISATLTPFLIYAYLRFQTDISFPHTLFLIVGVTTVVWLLTTLLTKPVEEARLIDFYRRVRPGGWGWSRVARLAPEVVPDSGMGWLLLDWLAGVVLVYATLFGAGKLILGEFTQGVPLLLLGLLGGVFVCWDLSHRGWSQVTR